MSEENTLHTAPIVARHTTAQMVWLYTQVYLSTNEKIKASARLHLESSVSGAENPHIGVRKLGFGARNARNRA